MAHGLLVNLDAMISRADFAQTSKPFTYENVSTISIRDLTKEGLIVNSLRKPDFQRETNHWVPAQVVSLLECFMNGDLIPSVILWQSETFLFVIDGCHRLSILRAWVEDDYGDGPLSTVFFGDAISKSQRKAATQTRALISEKIGSYQHLKSRIDKGDLDVKLQPVMNRGIPIQWVKGDADKAESSFFKINTQGTPLDDVEQVLLRLRKRPIAIAARAVIRAGKGHKYWSSFTDKAIQNEIEEMAKSLHQTLFDPELTSPVKTLDLPLGGSKGVRTALQVLLEFFRISSMSQAETKIDVSYGTDEVDGKQTMTVLTKANKLAARITGYDIKSLGLHPAIYFYGPTGIHSSPMFLGTAMFLQRRLMNNDSSFFESFTKVRRSIEDVLIAEKDLIATILQKLGSRKRSESYCDLLTELYKASKEIENPASERKKITEKDLVNWAGVSGKIVVGEEETKSLSFSDDTKSKIFIVSTLKNAPTCPLCRGYLDISKSVSYDHKLGKKDGGLGDAENLQLTHPYCNSIKN